MQAAVRTAGIFLIFLASCSLGISAEYQMKKRWMVLRELCELFRYLEKEMIYHRTPLAEALQLAAKNGNGDVGAMFACAAEKMQNRTGQAFSGIWEEAVRKHLGQGSLRAQELQTVRESWAALCNSDVVLQKTMLEKQGERFAVLQRDAEQDYREKSGLYRKLWAAGGVFLIIILL